MTIACKHVIDTEELSALNDSLVSVLLSIDSRIQNLEGILFLLSIISLELTTVGVFKQTHIDVQARLGNFAFGIVRPYIFHTYCDTHHFSSIMQFQLSYGDIKRIPIQNSFGTWVDEDEANAVGKAPLTLSAIKAQASHVPLATLKYGIQDAFHSTNYYEFEPARLRRTSHPIQGTWTGHCSRTEGDEVINYILRISFRLSSDLKQLIGKGEDFSTTFSVEGRVKRSPTGYNLDFSIVDDDELPKTASGTFDPANDVITMAWSDRRKKDNPDEPYYRPFQLRRTPPSLLRYRYSPREFSEDPVRSRWAFACNAALHQAQEKLWSRKFFEARFQERKRFVELTTRSLIVSMGLTPQRPLTPAETGELEYLRRDLNPSEARFYHALSSFEIQKLPWHP